MSGKQDIAPTNRDLALEGKAVHLTDARLREMQQQAIHREGIDCGQFHWHWAAAINELIELRAIHSAGAQS